MKVWCDQVAILRLLGGHGPAPWYTMVAMRIGPGVRYAVTKGMVTNGMATKGAVL